MPPHHRADPDQPHLDLHDPSLVRGGGISVSGRFGLNRRSGHHASLPQISLRRHTPHFLMVSNVSMTNATYTCRTRRATHRLCECERPFPIKEFSVEPPYGPDVDAISQLLRDAWTARLCMQGSLPVWGRTPSTQPPAAIVGEGARTRNRTSLPSHGRRRMN